MFDDHGTEDALSCAERMVAAGSTVEIVTPDRHVGQEVTGTAYPAYLATFYAAGVRMTPDHRLVAVRRTADRRLEVDLWNDYTRRDDPAGRRPGRRRARLAAERRALPRRCVDGSIERRRARPRRVHRAAGRRRSSPTRRARYQLFRIGDAVASRNIHAAIYDGAPDRDGALGVGAPRLSARANVSISSSTNRRASASKATNAFGSWSGSGRVSMTVRPRVSSPARLDVDVEAPAGHDRRVDQVGHAQRVVDRRRVRRWPSAGASS